MKNDLLSLIEILYHYHIMNEPKSIIDSQRLQQN